MLTSGASPITFSMSSAASPLPGPAPDPESTGDVGDRRVRAVAGLVGGDVGGVVGLQLIDRHGDPGAVVPGGVEPREAVGGGDLIGGEGILPRRGRRGGRARLRPAGRHVGPGERHGPARPRRRGPLEQRAGRRGGVEAHHALDRRRHRRRARRERSRPRSRCAVPAAPSGSARPRRRARAVRRSRPPRSTGRPGSAPPGVRPRARSDRRTVRTWAAVAPKRRANCAGVR